MEKITELSKPVVYAYRADANKRAKFDIPTSWQFWHSTICDGVAAEPPPLGDEYEYKPLYSQEYVSALLQRIASQDDHINQQQDRIESLEKKSGDLGKALGAAEKRLVHIKDACDTWERKAISNFEECATMSQHIEELEQAMRHIHGAALDITVPRTAIAKAAEFAAEHAAMKEQSNG
jgi:hypothetical protein